MNDIATKDLEARMNEALAEEDTIDAVSEIADYIEGSRLKLVYIPIEKLFPHPDNPRKDLGDLTELAESIRAGGVRQNLTVVSHAISTNEYTRLLDVKESAYKRHMVNHAFDGGYTIIIGHRRAEAAKLAGLTELPCVVTEMTYEEQVATMLLENMQRSDLTTYEQAQGFRQLSMDFGMSVDAIAKKTGFSSSTVRNRLKMCNLNQETLRKVSAERQISLTDLDKLYEIKDPKVRDKVLETIGTNNFDSQVLSAKNAQERKEKEEGWRKLMAERGFAEIPSQERHGNKYKTGFYLDCLPDAAALDEKLEPGVEYHWYVDWGTLYLKTLNPVSDESDAASKKKERETQLRMEAANGLKEAFERAYRMRSNFIRDYTETDARKHLVDILRMGIERKLAYEHNRTDMLQFFLSIGYAEQAMKDSESYPEWEEFKGVVIGSPYKSALSFIYASIGDSASSACYKTSSWSGHHGEYEQSYDHEKLTLLYESLERLGYEMSDEERELMDGTSALYYHGEEDGSDES